MKAPKYLIERGGHAELWLGDCIDFPLRRRGYCCIIADPPYNLGVAYDGNSDKWPSDGAYYKWLQKRTWRMLQNLHAVGSLWLVLPPKTAMVMHYYITGLGAAWACDPIIWHYRFGQNTDANFIPSYAMLLRVYRPAAAMWYPDNVLVRSDRLAVYGDGRTAKSSRRGWRVPLDVWTEFPRVTGNSAERRPQHPNQLPEKLVERMIACCTQQGDLVLDPFLGSGTTAVVARAMRRHVHGIEISERYLRSAYRRLLRGAVRI